MVMVTALPEAERYSEEIHVVVVPALSGIFVVVQ